MKRKIENYEVVCDGCGATHQLSRRLQEGPETMPMNWIISSQLVLEVSPTGKQMDVLNINYSNSRLDFCGLECFGNWIRKEVDSCRKLRNAIRSA